MYLLDTNICIYAMKDKYPALTRKLLSKRPDHLFLSAVTVGELEYGAAKSRWGGQNHDRMLMFISSFIVLPFTKDDALLFGKPRAALAVMGTPIGAYDLMIASQGIARNLTVVTHNLGEFQRVPGIHLEDWTS